MYRCKDCGKEYTEKVDYCDCGNNTFDYVEDIVPLKQQVKQEKKPRQPLSIEQKSEIISKIFFVVCLILSLIVWLMPVKVEQTVTEEAKEQKVDLKSIPNLEKIWNNAPPKIAETEKTEEKPVQETPLDAIRQVIPDKLLNKPVQTTQKPVQTNNKNQNKNVSAQPKSTNTQSKPVTTQPKSNAGQQKPANTQSKSDTTQSKPVTQNKQTSNPNNLKPVTSKNTQNSVQNKPAEKPKPVYNPNSSEMLKYKSSLRSAMFAKLPIGSVKGSGSCSVQFAVDKNGKLINRAFSKQSDNKSLNDAVYYMLMSVPHFASPPDNYNQELIRMNISINEDGSYEISIH